MYNASVPTSSNERLDRVRGQLRLYEHPLLDFDARAKNDAVELIIQFKNPVVPVHTYIFGMHPRDWIIRSLSGHFNANSTIVCTTT